MTAAEVWPENGDIVQCVDRVADLRAEQHQLFVTSDKDSPLHFSKSTLNNRTADIVSLALQMLSGSLKASTKMNIKADFTMVFVYSL